MSSYLSPIHFIVYDKIINQHNINEALINLGKASIFHKDFELHCSKYNKNLKIGNLEEIIDKSQIHHWLDTEIFISEDKCGYLCNFLIEKQGLNSTGEWLYNIGNKIRDDFIKAKKLNYEMLNSNPLDTLRSLFNDGMPCDKGLQVIEDSPSKISFQISSQSHHGFMNQIKEEEYFFLRKRFMEGVLSTTPWNIDYSSKGIYTLLKEI